MLFKKKALAGVLVSLCSALSLNANANEPYELMGVTTQTGEKASYLATEKHITLPVTVINGKSDGPVLLLSAGIHGDEFPSMYALQQLQQNLDPNAMSGVLVVLHLANLDGFHSNRIALNPKDEKNLNREFPGSADGTPTEQIAEVLTREFIGKADFLIDMHSGSANQTLLNHVYSPFVGNEELDALTFEFAKATGMQHIVLYGDRPRDPNNSISYPNTAMTRGKPGLTTEIGHLAQSDEESVAKALEVARNAMYFLKMLPEKPKPHPEPIIYETIKYPKSSKTGFFKASVVIGDKVTTGQDIGTVTDYFGNLVESLKSPVDGTVMMVNQMPAIKDGQSVMAIGVEISK
ncbi:succinylglutamate desuccinylase/aspartoacylase family protein [Alteromonas portus]|uniref:succinylglutamate desuccinylase/aspartoacylase family protein n=1 Tax=Alteromonas portus TaxID=2565549 RepID=UPI003BF8BBA0